MQSNKERSDAQMVSANKERLDAQIALVNKVGSRHAFYGSLRRGEYNANRREDEEYKYIKTVTIKGYELYAISAYPAAVRSEDKDAPLVVDIFELKNPGSVAGIYGMEIGAGYGLQHVDIEGEKTAIYLYPTGYENTRKVQDGDWSKYLADRASASSSLAENL